jgi:hypothetical protein
MLRRRRSPVNRARGGRGVVLPSGVPARMMAVVAVPPSTRAVMSDPLLAEPGDDPGALPPGGRSRGRVSVGGLLRAVAFWLLVVLLLAATVFVVLWDGWR